MRCRDIGAALAFTASAALTGCTLVDLSQEREALAQAIPCCLSLSEVPSVSFDEVRDQIVFLDSSRPVIDLPTGKTFVLLVELPEDRKLNRLVINSYYTDINPYRHRVTSRILYPTISILNSARDVVRVVPESDFSFAREKWGEPNRLTTKIALSPDQEAEKYVAIYTTEEAVASQRRHTVQTTTGVMAGTVPIIIPIRTNRVTPGSAVGRIKLRASSE